MFKLFERKRLVVEAAQWFPYMVLDGVTSVKKKLIDPDSGQEKVVVDGATINDAGNKVEIAPGDYVVRVQGGGLRRIPYDSFAYDYDEISKEELSKIRAEYNKGK